MWIIHMLCFNNSIKIMYSTNVPKPTLSGPATSVPVSRPEPRAHIPAESKFLWSTGFFDCFSDVPTCCVTFWCPCITFGRIAEIVDRGSSSCGLSGALYAWLVYVTGCACCYSCFYRTKMRKQYLLLGSPYKDCLVHFFCETCALCQEYRELKNRGFEMDIGWHENVERQNRGVVMAPISEGGMSR